jgi:SAM-dependent methyltransferase
VTLGAFWEDQAEAWVRWARKPGHDTYWRFHRDRFLELLPPPGRLTLDIGCGEGRLTRDLHAGGHRVTGLDASPTMVRHARQAAPELDIREADAAALPFENGSADLALAFMSLMNVDRMEEAVRETARVLEPGGRFCIALTHPINTAGAFVSEAPNSAFVIDGSYFDPVRKTVPVERDGLRMTFVDAHRPLQDYFRALESAGFLVERLREIPDGTPEPVPRPSMLRWRRVPLFLHLRAVKT